MKILFVLSRVPYPLHKGDKLRAFNQMKELSKNHSITLLAINEPNNKYNSETIDILNKYCEKVVIVNLNYFGICWNILGAITKNLPLQVGYFYSKKAKKVLDNLIANSNFDCIYCQLIRTAEYIKDIKSPTKIIDYMDAFSKGIERQIPNAKFPMSWILKYERRMLEKYEAIAYNYFDKHSIISNQDKNHLTLSKNLKDKVKVIPNGVDIEYFHPTPENKTIDLLYCGNMNYPPNISAAIYLVKNIIPLLLIKHPNIKTVIAGTNPSKEVRDLESNNVKITGWVKDIRPYYSKSKIFIAPMQTSIGMQNKILEAMAMQLPCITSQMANNAIEAESGTNVLIGNSPEEYKAHIEKLLSDPALSSKIGMNGFNFVKGHYSWSQTTKELEQILCNFAI